ncbi:hypothetical protein [Streptomyces cinereoruber]|uniref:hypothetical protein n=1 Tax=Streptomyces cinereoruber TaxID=67260 RepID=UPI003626EDE5
MKLWELASVCRSHPACLPLVESERREEWRDILDAWKNFQDIVSMQDRRVMDRELPDDLCRIALEGVAQRYLINGGVLRAESGEKSISAVTIFDLYGGGILEEVAEYGSARVANTES